MKLRKATMKSSAAEIYLRSAEWQTADGRFRFGRFERDDADPFGVTDGGWQIYCGAFEDDDLIDWLRSLGLWEASFPTRRAAVAALELALNGAAA